MIFVVFAIHFLVAFEGLPLSYIFFGILSHGTYYLLLDKFPQIKLTSVLLWVAVGMS